MNSVHKGVVWLGLLVAVVSVRASAIVATAFNWDQMSHDYIAENEAFQGNWQERSDWAGTLCNGHYAYNVAVNGIARVVDFKVLADDSIEAYADLANVNFGVDGSYRSSYSACVPLAGWLGASTDRVQITAQVDLGQDESMKDLKVRITRTQFDTIHIGKYVPRWFEDFVTGLVNRSLEKVWSSRLGEWLSDRISKEIKKKIPTRM